MFSTCSVVYSALNLAPRDSLFELSLGFCSLLESCPCPILLRVTCVVGSWVLCPWVASLDGFAWLPMPVCLAPPAPRYVPAPPRQRPHYQCDNKHPNAWVPPTDTITTNGDDDGDLHQSYYLVPFVHMYTWRQSYLLDFMVLYQLTQ